MYPNSYSCCNTKEEKLNLGREDNISPDFDPQP